MRINKVKASVAAIVFAGVFAAGGSSAASLIANGGFEQDNLGTGGYVYPGGTLDSWTYGGAVLINGQGASAWWPSQPLPPAGFGGDQFAGVQSTSTLSQTFTAPAGSLSISWVAGGRPASDGCCNGDQTYKVLVDGVSEGTYSTTSGQAFAPKSFRIQGLAAGSHTLTFAGQDGADETAFIDNVSAVAVPEPATWALMLAGLGAMGLVLRRGRQGRLRAA